MTEAEQTAMSTENNTLKARVRTLESQQDKIVAMATVGALLREAGATVKQSLLERVCESPKMKDGKVDPEWAKEIAQELGGVSEAGGRVTGMGEGHVRTAESGKAISKEEGDSFKESLKSLGVPEAGLAYAIGGRP